MNKIGAVTLENIGCGIFLGSVLLGSGLILGGCLKLCIAQSWSALAISLIASGSSVMVVGMSGGGIVLARALDCQERAYDAHQAVFQNVRLYGGNNDL